MAEQLPHEMHSTNEGSSASISDARERFALSRSMLFICRELYPKFNMSGIFYWLVRKV